MAQDLVTLFNLALSAVGTRAVVASPDEQSREASICRLWYDTVRRQALSAAPWAMSRTVASLALVAQRQSTVAWTSTEPEPPWTYLYAVPTDFIYPRHLESYMNFVMTQRGDAKMLLCDDALPILTYTKDQSNPGAWDPTFWNAMINALGAAIAMSLHGKPTRADYLVKQANDAIIAARIAAANQDQISYESVPDWLLARGVSAPSQISRFIYPHGPLFSGAALT